MPLSPKRSDVLTKYGQAIAEDRAKLAELSDGMSKAGQQLQPWQRGNGLASRPRARAAPTPSPPATPSASLAKKYGVSLKAIEDANPGVDPTHLKLGQEITIPGSRASSSSSAPAPAPDAAPAPAPEPAATMAAPASAVTTQ